MTDSIEWTGRVGAAWAEEWRATDRSFAPVTERLLDHPATNAFSAALDIGCGAGELACLLAERRPGAEVTGIDISADLIAVARARCERAHFAEADAARFRPTGAPPDLIVSRHGTMFFADPVAAFAHLAATASPRAVLRFSCFRERAENGWAVSLGAVVVPETVQPGDPRAPGPFAFGDRGHVAAILAAAGWRDAEFEAFDYPMVVGEGPDAAQQAQAYFRRIGPAARALAGLQGEARLAAEARLRAVVEAHLEHARVAMPAAAWIVTARAPG